MKHSTDTGDVVMGIVAICIIYVIPVVMLLILIGSVI